MLLKLYKELRCLVSEKMHNNLHMLFLKQILVTFLKKNYSEAGLGVTTAFEGIKKNAKIFLMNSCFPSRSIGSSQRIICSIRHSIGYRRTFKRDNNLGQAFSNRPHKSKYNQCNGGARRDYSILE